MKIFLLFLGLLIPSIVTLSAFAEPSIKDDNFIVQKYVTEICCSPTTMTFEGKDILILQKDSGNVILIRDGKQQNSTVHENITNTGEQGMLGITTVGSKVYLYFTESSKQWGPPLGKRVYSYDWNGQSFVNRTLIKDLSQTQFYHNGGAMVTSKNGSVFLVVGDAGRYGKLENHRDGEPDDTGVILRIAPPGQYYAMGIRNSFGLAFDPVTGNLWDTENGPDFGDEVNIVPPNFNSGWDVIMGPANSTQLANLPGFPGYVYHDPQFTWTKTVAPTGLSFINSKEFEKYKNSLFVGDCNNGNLYRFELNSQRDGFVFNSVQLTDKVVNIGDSMDEIIFGTGFGCITDVKQGPDGLLYIVSLSDGTIYRIVPKDLTVQSGIGFSQIQYAVYVVAASIAAISVTYVIKIRRKNNQKSESLVSNVFSEII
ncbi:MAG TPA: PQQ-dependent sugar dehydrogenase [Nitrosopumilaceae archaeon]|nr:PQQ-dependent sugar dehydrogenase [Nitrosopumilaceae archaeon]